MAYKWIINGIVFSGDTYEGFNDDEQKTPIVRPQLFLIAAEFVNYPLHTHAHPRLQDALQKIDKLQDPKLQQLIRRELKTLNDSHSEALRAASEKPSLEDYAPDDPEDIVGAKALIYIGTVDEFPEILVMAQEEAENNLYYSERREDFAERGIAPVLKASYDRFLALEAIDFEGIEEALNENGEGRWQISQQLQTGWKLLGQLVRQWREDKRMRGKELADLAAATRQWYAFKGESAVIEFLKRLTEKILTDANGYIRRCARAGCYNLYTVHNQIECLDPDRIGFTRAVPNRKFCSYRCRRSHQNHTHYARRRKDAFPE